ncbi:MAG: RNase P subunit p30 family protein [Candidatus Thorarchaeota archaeon]
MLNAIDLDVRIQSEENLSKFLDMAQNLGYSAIATTLLLDAENTETSPLVYRRINLDVTKLSSLKKKVVQARAHYHVVAAPIRGVDTTNWAAEDSRIDILTVDPTGKEKLRKTTANISAEHDTALEICIAPLLGCNGLERSKMIRVLHDSISVATRAGMKIVLSSSASFPIQMRAPVALSHIAMTLGMDRKTAADAIQLNPQMILARNIKRMKGNQIGPGIEIIRGDKS